jgi:TetR/AcrR family transcriptional repressor of nem operon
VGRTREFDRDAVLDTAIDVFWSNGYEATSLDDLTAAMGIGRGSLYNEFGSKHALFLESLDLYRERRRAELERALWSAPSARAGIEAVFRRITLRLRRDSGRRGCLLVNAAAERAGSDVAVAERVREALGAFASAFRGALERGQRQGEFDPAMDSSVMADHLASTLICLRLLARVGDARVADNLVRMSLIALDTARLDGNA